MQPARWTEKAPLVGKWCCFYPVHSLAPPWKMSEAVSAEAARKQLRDLGFVIVPDVVAATECNQLTCHLDRPAEGRAGSRVLLKESWCRELADTIRRHPKIVSSTSARVSGGML